MVAQLDRAYPTGGDVAPAAWRADLEAFARDGGWAAVIASTGDLDSLSKADIVELKSLKNMPWQAKMLMEAVCILFEVEPVEHSPGVLDFWRPSLSLLSDSGFLQRLIDFDKDGVSAGTIAQIERYIQNPQLRWWP